MILKAALLAASLTLSTAEPSAIEITLGYQGINHWNAEPVHRIVAPGVRLDAALFRSDAQSESLKFRPPLWLKDDHGGFDRWGKPALLTVAAGGMVYLFYRLRGR